MIICSKHIPAEFGAISDVLVEWRKRWPQMGVLILLPEAEKQFVPVLQSAFRQQNVPMVGGIFPALVTDTGFVTAGAWLLCFDRMPPWFLVSVRGGASELVGASKKVLEENDAGGVMPTLFMIFDGMLPTISTLLNHLRLDLKSRVRYAGVNAGSETFQPLPCLFDTEATLGDGVLGLLLRDGPNVVVRHGYPVSKALMRATSGEGNRIDTINCRPAFEVYQEVIKAEYGVDLTHENFYDHAVHFPFGVVTVLDVLVRIPVAFNDDGSLFCVGEISPDSLLKLLKAPDLETSGCVRDIAARLDTPQGAMTGRPLLIFYCAGRRMHFGVEKATREVMQLKELSGASTVYGALSLGEIDQIDDLGFPRFHNAALVCVTQNSKVDPA